MTRLPALRRPVAVAVVVSVRLVIPFVVPVVTVEQGVSG